MEKVVLNIHTTKAGEIICVQTGWLWICSLWPFGAVEACGLTRDGMSGFLFTSTYVCEQWQHKIVKVMTRDSLTRKGPICTV